MQMARPEASPRDKAKENTLSFAESSPETHRSLLPTPAHTLANGGVHVLGQKCCWAAAPPPSIMETVLPVPRVDALC